MTAAPFLLLSVEDVAKRLDVCAKTVRRWIKRHDLHVHRLGRLIRITEEDLQSFIRQRRE